MMPSAISSLWLPRSYSAMRIHTSGSAAVKDPSLDVRRLRFYGENLRPFVERYGLLDRRLAMQVPPAMRTGGANVVAAYLRALFQADGCVRIREERQSSDIVFGTISPALANGVSELLNNLGIYNRVQVGHDSRETDRTTITSSLHGATQSGNLPS